MKHENHTGTSRPALAVQTLLSGIAAIALLGFSLNAQAQIACTVDNWDDQTGLSDANAGLQTGSVNNRRYGGPCGLRVPVDGTPRFLTDESPLSESTYIVRFYVFLNAAGSDPILIFSADDGTDDVIQVWYENGADLTLTVFESDGTPHDSTFTGIGNGWHSIELVWESSDSSENIRFALNTTEEDDEDSVLTVDTTGVSIVNAHLGNVNGANTGGAIDFDDLDSRRITRPGRLLVGDANGDGVINFFDLAALNGEEQGTPAMGQPDCNEDGVINFFDLACVNGKL